MRLADILLFDATAAAAAARVAMLLLRSLQRAAQWVAFSGGTLPASQPVLPLAMLHMASAPTAPRRLATPR